MAFSVRAQRLVEVGKGFSSTSVNTTVFRNNSIVTHGNTQYISYYDAEGWLMLGKRRLGTGEWILHRTQYKGHVKDAHNIISMMVDGDGYLHLSFDHHGHKLNYCRSIAPDTLVLGDKEPMIGNEEEDVTYPEFHLLADGGLLFVYRSGASGRGNMVMNRYDVKSRKWERVQDVLVDGENERNAYWQLYVDQSGTIQGMHANTQIPKVIGFKRIADLEGNRDWSEAARYFWETVVNHRSITIGGNSVREHFHPADDFSSMLTSEQGPETCNTYNMLRLTKMLYETSADVHFMDYYERALYNHILSTQDPVQGGFVYFTPMRAGHYRVYSQPQTSFWCCVGSGMENHARYGEMIYGHKDNNLYVNLFIPSTLRWGDTQIEQQTAFPDEEGSTLVISPEKGKKEFTLLFRIPEWTKPEALRLSVNGKRQNVTVKEGYVSLNRTWSKGDKVRLELPMHLRAIALPDGSANYSILYGPIVLAARLGKQNQDGMFADDSRGGHIAAGPRLPLQTMPVIVGDKNNLLSHLKKVEGKPLTFTLSGVYPERYEGMIVEPFFRLYECRYMVYWPVLSVQELQARQEQLAKEEKERAALDGMTADKVICGEQQPESDHFIRMENSRTGDDEGIHWREAAGWFSYRMKTNGKQVNKVRIRFRSEIRKDAKVWINGQEVGRLAGKPASDVSVGILDVPASMQSNEQLEIKIGKGNEKVTPHIYEVRLVTE